MNNFRDDVSSSTSSNDEASTANKRNDEQTNCNMINIESLKETNASFYNLCPIIPPSNIIKEPPIKKRKICTIWPQRRSRRIKEKQQKTQQQRDAPVLKQKKSKKKKKKKMTLRAKRNKQLPNACLFPLIIAPKMIKSSLSLMITSKSTNHGKASNIRPNIERSERFGDYFWKKQRALSVYAKFCGLQSGKLFETENVIKGCFGVNASEMMENKTFSNRLLPIIFEKNLFVNLPENLTVFVSNLFKIVSDAKHTECTAEISKLCAKFAKYHFNLIHLCYAMSADYEYRRRRNYDNEIDANFDGVRWISLVYELKNECIRNGYSELFEPFDPSSNALFGCLWKEQDPVTLFEVELKLQAQIYCTNESVANDLKTAFGHLERIFGEDESMRTFIDGKLKKIWMDTTIGGREEVGCASGLAEDCTIFETVDECVEFFEKVKKEKQKEQSGKLRMSEILGDRVIETKLEGNVCFYCVKYADFPNDYVWESRAFMLTFYRKEIKKYIAAKKRRGNGQFAKNIDLSKDLRRRMNQIGTNKGGGN